MTEKKQNIFWSKVKKYLNHVFIDGLSGMALGLFATLIIGTIIAQIGSLIGGTAGKYINMVASVTKALTGAGIGFGVAYKFKESILVSVSAGVAGMIGAFAASILSGTAFPGAGLLLMGPGEPLGAFLGALAGIEVGHLVSGKTKVDILVTPLVTITVGATVGLLIGPPISKFMEAVGAVINWGAEQQPFIVGLVVSVVMGCVLTLPISSAALGIILKLSGLAAGAAAAGCCAQMIGFAVSSYRENKVNGLIAQGLGTSMLQMPNIVRKPVIWIPPIVASAVTGPISAWALRMTCDATGSGMGTSGLVGPIMTFKTMLADGFPVWYTILSIIGVQFILPAVISLFVSELMRKKGIIKLGDMKLDM
ncbi:MAG TPA: PTS sugar transporter subunit IIC [Clostridia bacterium]|nr:PTS sugar transporter subunit IIC [Clostridia bacterium]HOR89895.1 PTS sugar transporter subunit IIC [Clostridia bacterium]HPL07603.1 PTS sugar transporter subunit IIC [Clostridia bacterium]